jgi:3-oxoacyl-[acyl-carrier protein] reductase
MGMVDGKTAIVTGAARGIGQAIAKTLAVEGANLALCDVQSEWLAETAGAVRDLGRRAECYAADVSSREAVEGAVKAIKDDFERIDILVNNAGITRDNILPRMTEEQWDQVIDVNLKGTFLWCKAVGRIMMRQHGGAIVNIASVIGLIGNPGQVNYAASKAGVIALTKSIARELGSRDVRANAVAPGFIRSAMTDSLDDTTRQRMLANIPCGRFGEPEDVANVVAFLSSDLSRYVNGQTLSVCGGMVTQ